MGVIQYDDDPTTVGKNPQGVTCQGLTRRPKAGYDKLPRLYRDIFHKPFYTPQN